MSPGLLAGTGAAIAALAYARGVAVLWRRAGRHAVIPPWRAAGFVAGLASLVLAIGPPLDGLADALFSAHMAQHLVLVLLAPPLLIAGLPEIALPWALPRSLRPGWLTWWHTSALHAAGRRLAHPLPAVLLHALALWTWHLPGPYQAALEHEGLHALEHACFLGTALLFWGMVLARAGRASAPYPARLVAVFVVMIQGGALGALLMFTSPWYRPAPGLAAYGLAPAQDQQLAGLMMWIPGGVAYIAAALVLFRRWMHAEERHSLQAGRRMPAGMRGGRAPGRSLRS